MCTLPRLLSQGTRLVRLTALVAQAALGAGMRCVVTYTDSTSDQEFHGAEHIMAEFKADTKLADLLKGDSRTDDRPGRSDADA